MAHRIALKQGKVSELETGNAHFTETILRSLREKLGLDIHYLLTGKGDMFSKTQTKACSMAEECLAYNTKAKEAIINVGDAWQRVILQGKNWKRIIEIRKGR